MAWIPGLDLLDCPSCRRGGFRVLENGPDLLVCQVCGDRFPLKEGVACFQRRFDDYSENYDQICADDLKEPKTPGVVKEILFGLVSERARGVTCDVGCGDGFVVRQINVPLRSVVDIAFEYLRRLPASALRIWSRAEMIPLRDHCIDTIVCTDLIEHVQDAGELAGEISRLVNPTGRILLAFPFEQDLSVYELPAYKEKYAKYKYVHLRSINDDLIRHLFPGFTPRFSHLITEGMPLMEFKPYPIKFLELVPKNE